MSSIKERIALFIAKRKFFSGMENQLNFAKSFSDSKNILVILPTTAEETLSAADIPAYFKIHKKEVTILGRKDIIPIALNSHKFESISFDEESKTRLGLPNKILTEALQKNSFDIVIDLNRNNNLFSSILANMTKSKLVIGFKKERSDEFYNLQVANNQNNAEISYRNFLNSIQMFY